MRIAVWWALWLGAACLAGCGSDEAREAAPAPAAVAAPEPQPEEIRGELRCPAAISSPARAADAPVDDVQGVRPGMRFEEAANVVRCSDERMLLWQGSGRGFSIQTYGETLRQGFDAGFAGAARARSGDAAAQEDMQPGQSKWYVGTLGLPGEERVVSAAREEWFEAGRNPSVASVAQALVVKYGTPTRDQQAHGHRYLTWAYDPLARPVTQGSPLFDQCFGASDPDGGTHFSPDCGIVVSAIVFPLPGDAERSQYYQVGVLDHAGGYAAALATEQALLQRAAERAAARQREQASKQDVAPQR